MSLELFELTPADAELVERVREVAGPNGDHAAERVRVALEAAWLVGVGQPAASAAHVRAWALRRYLGLVQEALAAPEADEDADGWDAGLAVARVLRDELRSRVEDQERRQRRAEGSVEDLRLPADEYALLARLLVAGGDLAMPVVVRVGHLLSSLHACARSRAYTPEQVVEARFRMFDEVGVQLLAAAGDAPVLERPALAAMAAVAREESGRADETDPT